MIKLTANLSKKVPIAGLSYSSQSFMAGLEVELSDAAALPEVQTRIREVYALLEQSINEQIATHQASAGQQERPAPAENRGPRRDAGRREDHRDDRRGGRDNAPYPASQAQRKATAAIAQERGMLSDDLTALLRQEFRKNSAEELTLREASRLIGLLKEQQRQAG